MHEAVTAVTVSLISGFLYQVFLDTEFNIAVSPPTCMCM